MPKYGNGTPIRNGGHATLTKVLIVMEDYGLLKYRNPLVVPLLEWYKMYNIIFQNIVIRRVVVRIQ